MGVITLEQCDTEGQVQDVVSTRLESLAKDDRLTRKMQSVMSKSGDIAR